MFLNTRTSQIGCKLACSIYGILTSVIDGSTHVIILLYFKNECVKQMILFTHVIGNLSFNCPVYNYISEFEGECSLMHSVIEIVLVDEFIHDLCTYKGCFSNRTNTFHICKQDYFTIALLLLITVLKVLLLVLVILWIKFQLITG